MGGKIMALILFENVYKEYGTGDSLVRALDDANFSVEQGELAVILGSSGAGKTTALNILGGMDTATRGRVLFDGNDITHWNETQLCQYRRTDVGFVFQFYNLVPNLTALENVELAAQICTDSLDAAETLQMVGLGDRMANFPAQLSGGEQQRVSIARALAKRPKLLLCDEPTGALDYVTGKQILQLLQDTCRRDGITIVIITHNSAIAPMADKMIRFRSGKVVDVKVNAEPVDIAEIEW
jgi:putative ABC transport system ATP-binding protein